MSASCDGRERIGEDGWRGSDGGAADLCEQEIATCFSHEFFDPDVFPKIFAGFDWLGSFRDDGDDRSVNCGD